MTDDQKPVTGPIPIYVRTIPTGVVLDLAALRDLVIGDVIDALLDPADTGLWDRLHELADLGMADMPHVPMEGRLLTENLIADLGERASSRVPLYGPAALELTRKLRAAAAPKAVPPQRAAGAA
ncbi:hypothetical protein GTY67_26405 [Streptomyces sp. SID8374]|uniref:hypothetical protein n=1 Tax=Streptomyces sp. SID8374 TaxID=2690354 RepID=UPI001371616B|nr:hypothetical protein [Streptomyces sp. SID8374]MYX16884.1 hypothetical protein [Streptomyces sp. SID8374]